MPAAPLEQAFAISGIDLYPDSLTLAVGGGTAHILVGLGRDFQYSEASDGTRYFVTNPDVLEVSADGLARGLAVATTRLTVVNGATYATTTDGTLVVDNETTGQVTITVKPAVTDDLSQAQGLYYDVQSLIGAVVTTETAGALNVNTTQDVTRAVA